MKSCAQAAFAASMISPRVAPLAEGDVGADAVAEQIDILADIAGLLPQ